MSSEREWGRKVCNSGVAADAVYSGAYHFLAGWVCGNFPGVEVDGFWVEEQLRRHAARRVADNPFAWSDSSWRMWWKNRVEESGLLPPGCRLDPVSHAAGTLHTGGTWYSTPEEMERLKFPDDFVAAATVATPGIERVSTRPGPIDRVAAVVTDFPSNRDYGDPVG